jgi:hypothetical protein
MLFVYSHDRYCLCVCYAPSIQEAFLLLAILCASTDCHLYQKKSGCNGQLEEFNRVLREGCQ